MVKAVTLSWPNHAKDLTAGILELFKDDFKTDFHLSINGYYVKAHQLILSTFCSNVKSCLETPTLILGEQSTVTKEDASTLLHFMYSGEVSVEEDRLSSVHKLSHLMGFTKLTDVIAQFLTNKRRYIRRQRRKASEVSNDKCGERRLRRSSVKIETTDGDNEQRLEFESLRCKQYVCSFCQAKFQDSSDWSAHLESHKSGKRFVCEYCPYKTRSNQCLAGHMINKHQMDLKGNRLAKNIRCPQCTYTCCAQFQLKNHVYSVHSTKRNVCEFCGYRCNGNANMMKHKKLVHSSSKPLMCETCGYRTKLIGHLRNHALTHQDTKVKCDICDASVKSTYLSTHKRIHSSKPRPFKCFLCSFTSWKNWNLKFHLKTVHKIYEANSNESYDFPNDNG